MKAAWDWIEELNHDLPFRKPSQDIKGQNIEGKEGTY